MTAEIAVMNKNAVALAADSAVTVSSGGSSKIYNGAEKLFALTKHHPVGIMVYGTGSLCNVPWELIIKQYRKKLGLKSFDTLDGYAEDFWNFLCSNNRLIPEDLRENSIQNTYVEAFDCLFSIVDDRGAQFVDKNDRKPSEAETFQIISECCDLMIETLSESLFFNGFNQQSILDLKPSMGHYTDAIIKSNLENVELTQDIKDKISSIFSLITCKQNNLGVNTGVVFAGYGNQEYFPVVLAFNVQGFSRGKLRFAPNLSKSAAAGQSGLMAYAQDEEVSTFMMGINPNLYSRMSESYKNLFDDIFNKVNELLDCTDEKSSGQLEAIKAELLKHSNKSWDKTSSCIDNYIETEHTDKVLQMIEFLPKDELAYMAESLVNMTAFKRKVSNDSETVGGPIDVAIISKGDGFIWVKRKHYFAKELNCHYFTDFLQGDEHDQ